MGRERRSLCIEVQEFAEIRAFKSLTVGKTM